MAHILFIDDVVELTQLYSLVFTKHGHQVMVANSEMQALSTLENTEFDYVFLDIKMPDYDGLDFLEKADITRRYPKTKIIILSNSESERLSDKAKALGASHYLIKVDYSPYGLAQMMDEGKI